MHFRGLIFLLLVLRVVHAFADSQPAFEFKNLSNAHVDSSTLSKVAAHAVPRFESAFGKLAQPVVVEYGVKPCYRTGYSQVTGTIRVCDKSNLPNSGLGASDVLAHEFFHAMYCQKRPQDCTAEKFSAVESGSLHEGLAYFFAYLHDENGQFGNEEGLAEKKYFARQCMALSAGLHEKGFAIAQELIHGKKNLSDIARVFADAGTPLTLESFFAAKVLPETPCLLAFRAGGVSPEIRIVPEVLAPSKLQKYKLKVGERVRFRVEMNESAKKAYPELEIIWAAPKAEDYALIAPSPILDGYRFSMTGVAPGSGKWIAVFFHQGVKIGSAPIYFLVR